MKKFILWDNDGVLVDTEKYYFEANKKLFNSLGHDLNLDTYKNISLKAGKSVLDYFKNFNFTDDQIKELRDQRDAIYENFLKGQDLALRGVPYKLEELSKNFRMGIVTSTKREFFNLIHSQTGFTKYFEFIIAREDYVSSKPDPEPYLLGIKKSGFEESEIIAIEDTPRGLKSATDAGLQCIIIKNEFTYDSKFKGASKVLKSIDELSSQLISSL